MTNIIEFLTTGMGDGGAETLVKDYALLLDKQRFQITIVTINPVDTTSANYKRLSDAGIQIVPIYRRKADFKWWIAQKLWNRCFHKRYVARKLLKIIKEKDAQVLHCHLEVLYAVASVSKRLKIKKLLFTCHSQPSKIFKPSRWENEEKSARILIKNNNLQMIALHDDMRRELNKRFGVENTIVIHNGIDFDKFRSVLENKNEIRQDIGINREAFVIGHVGRFSEAKNHGFLVDVFAEVFKRRTDSHLLMIGAGEKEEEVKGRLNSLGLEGYYTILSHRTDIPRLLKAMDVFVFPSLYEGLPVSIVEAQVAGLRTIASDVITKECFFSGDAVPLSIEMSPSKWADTILDSSIKSECESDINLFNMRTEIDRLGEVYEKD